MPEIGQNLVHYSIVAKIGKGGMGEVFRAKDQKLGRDVAIKVLPEEFAGDADRLARRQMEMKESGQSGEESAGPRRINIVLNWTEELKQRVPAK